VSGTTWRIVVPIPQVLIAPARDRQRDALRVLMIKGAFFDGIHGRFR
jgi:hypothetical protein